MLYLLALGIVLTSGTGVGLLLWALVLRPERRRHAAEVGALRGRVAVLTAEVLRVNGGDWVDPDAPTVRP